MKRIRFFINPENLSTYVDIFTNHGCVGNFTKLLVHHLSFFGSFKTLSILDVLLENRRGFNMKIGSKRRKRYFSDVNRILSECGELKISCCEEFPGTEHLLKASCASGLIYPSHKISVDEGFEIFNDIDYFDFEEGSTFATRPGINIVKGLKKVEPGSRYLENLLNFIRKTSTEVFSTEEITEIEECKRRRNEELREVNDKICSLKEEVEKITPIRQHYTVNCNINKIYKNNYYYTLFILDSLKPLFKPRCEEFLNAYYEAEEEYNRPGVTGMARCSEKYKEKVRKMVKYKDFKFPEEISNIAKSLEMVNALKEHDLELDKLDEYIAEYKKWGNKTPPYPKLRELKKLKVKTDKNDEFIRMMIKKQEVGDAFWADPEEIAKPMNFKLYSMVVNEGKYSVDVSHPIHRIMEDCVGPQIIEDIDKMKEDITLRMDETCFQTEADKLHQKIERIRSRFGRHVAKMISKNMPVLESAWKGYYKKIIDLRIDYVDFLNKMKCNFSFENLSLCPYEKEKISKSVDYIKSNEERYKINLEMIKDRTPNSIDCAQNRRILKLANGVDDKLPSKEWIEEAFKVEGKDMEDMVKDYENHLSTFKEITGLDPEGIIYGAYTVVKEMEEPLENETKSEFNRRMKKKEAVKEFKLNKKIEEQKEMQHWEFNDNTYMSDSLPQVLNNLIVCKVKGVKSITESDSKFLYDKQKSGLMPNYNLAKEKKIERIKEEIYALEKEKAEKSKVQKNEVIYDLLSRGKEDSFIHDDKKGKFLVSNPGVTIYSSGKIENSLNVKTIKRKKSREIYLKTVTKCCSLSKNVYDELEVEECIVQSDEIVDKIFESDIAPYMLYDYSRYRQYRKKKIEKVAQSFDAERPFTCFNEFDIENNSNANKKYKVINAVSYLKTILALKMLRVNTNKTVYTKFGLKKCQSKYLIRNFIKLAKECIKTGELEVKDIHMS